MRVWLNGEARSAAEGATVAEVLAAVGVPEAGVAVAVDGQLVPRRSWRGHVLAEGAHVEVVTAVQGG